MARIVALAALCAVLLVSGPADARMCRYGRSSGAGLGWSLLHPGLGEWYLKGWGPFARVPKKKFWFGFIPGFGWPGYLQFKSAWDAGHCHLNDELF